MANRVLAWGIFLVVLLAVSFGWWLFVREKSKDNKAFEREVQGILDR